MNSIERVLATLTFGRTEHGTPDRVPVFPVPLMQGAIVHNCTVEQYFNMPAAKIAQAQAELNNMLGGVPDAVAGIPNVIQDVSAFGVGLDHYFPNSTPAIEGIMIRNSRDLEKLRVPHPTDSPMLAKTLDIIENLASGIGQEKIVIGACIAPFSLPSMLMGTAKWMRLLFTDSLRRRYFERIMEVCEKWVQRWAKAQLDAGAHVVVLADGMASSTMIPRPVFEQYALPVIKRTIASIPGFVGYEAVGRVEPFVDLYADSGAIALLVGEEDDITRCKQGLRGRVGLIGNINNMKMRRWSAARVEMESKAAINQGKNGYGFILANQGPEIPFDTPVPNIAALVSAVEKYGRYEPVESAPLRLAA